MAEKKNQHFVPKYYFRYFNDRKEFISSLIVDKGILIPISSLSGQASKPYFYGDKTFENQVCIVENELKKYLDDFFNLKKIDKKLKKGILKNILYQEGRTVKKRKQTAQVWAAMAAMEDLNKNAKNIEEARAWYAENSIINNPDVQDEKDWQWRIMKMAQESLWTMEDLSCILLKNNTDTPFIFSDAPVIFMNPHMRNFYENGVVGNLSKGLVVVYPLSQNYSIVFFDADVYRIKNSYVKDYKKLENILNINKSEDIDVLNHLQYMNADSCIYSGKPEILRKYEGVIRDSKINVFECKIEVVEDSAYDFKVKFSGALDSDTSFPEIPIFDYSLSKRIVMARPKPYKKYKEINEKRIKKITNKEFINSLRNMSKDEVLDILSAGKFAKQS